MVIFTIAWSLTLRTYIYIYYICNGFALPLRCLPYPGRTYICPCPTDIPQNPNQIYTYVVVPSKTASQIDALCYTSRFRCRVVRTFQRAKLTRPRDPKSQQKLKKRGSPNMVFSVDFFSGLYAACVKRSSAVNPRSRLYIYIYYFLFAQHR